MKGWLGLGFSQWGQWGKTSVQTFSSRSLKTLTEGAATTGAYSNISQPSPKMSTLSFGGGSHLGVPCRAALLSRFEQEGGKKQVRIDIQTALEYLEGGNQVIPKSSPLQGLKAQSLQSLFVREVYYACFNLDLF